MDLGDPWAAAYLATFLLGLLTTGGMLLASAAHHGRGYVDARHGHAGHGHGHAAVHGGAAQGWGHSLGTAVAPLFNLSALLALLLCGGAAGYLGLRVAGRLVSVLTALSGGLGGAWLMAAVMRALWRFEAGVVRPSDPRGTVARVIAPIAAGQVGEIVFGREDGARQALPARAEAAEEIERGAEVVVMRVERGTAYVRRLDRAAGED